MQEFHNLATIIKVFLNNLGHLQYSLLEQDHCAAEEKWK